jgi:hypothetical protein
MPSVWQPLIIDLTDGRTKRMPETDSLDVGTGISSAAATDLTFSAGSGTITIAAGSVLGTTGSGNINLPNNGSAKFQIEGTAVGSTVTAPNLDTLTDGSDASALHTHAGLAQLTVTSGEGISAGSQVGIENVTGSPRAFLSYADATGNRARSIGTADATVLISTPLTVLTTGNDRVIPDARWEGGTPPVAADLGARVFVSKTTHGCITLDVSAYVAGDIVQEVGEVIEIGTGTSAILINTHREILL